VVESTDKSLSANILSVRQRIVSAAARRGRDPARIRLMAVTKTMPRYAVEAARAEGIDLFGENRVQEAQEKHGSLPAGYELHLIGHLQRNKAGIAADLFHCVQSIDAGRTADELERQCGLRGRSMDVLLEVNTSGEDAKSGFHSREGLVAGLEHVLMLPHLRVRGLMTVGPLTTDTARIRDAFSRLALLFGEIEETRGIPGFDTLSMGMSGDFEIAVEEGATLLRVGTAIFGQRPAP
jgi:pyridoxal phosphate enzyme (YggS family)